jgi:hypothetical protein
MVARTASWVVVLLLTSCAPTMRQVHRSDVYFERCHAAEMDEAVPLQSKYACWETWLEGHAEGQPPHRILYARERMVALAYGEPLTVISDAPSAEDTPTEASDAPPEATTSAEAEPSSATAMEGSAGAAPTGVTDGEAEAEVFIPERPRYQGNPACDPVCGPPWERCVARCTDGRQACVQACESEYRGCMRGCF